MGVLNQEEAMKGNDLIEEVCVLRSYETSKMGFLFESQPFYFILSLR